ncbi:MAG TPA: PLDc N-terminal domain-containing protein [Pilimelia sp.]|nr:PLDc N-terminal domain-containing protein [Pilimelia sp.]
MVRVFMLLFVAQIALMAVALISCLSVDADRVKGMPRYAWVIVIILVPVLGAVAWFTVGRRRGGPGGGSAPGRPRPRPVAPDDDPDFLRSLRPPPPEDPDGGARRTGE